MLLNLANYLNQLVKIFYEDLHKIKYFFDKNSLLLK